MLRSWFRSLLSYNNGLNQVHSFCQIFRLWSKYYYYGSHGWIRKKTPFIRWIDSPFLILYMYVQLHSSATLAWQNGSSECHFGTKLWARPQDVFGIAGSTWSRSLLSKDFARKSLDNNDRDQVEPAIPNTSCGLARSFVPKWRAWCRPRRRFWGAKNAVFLLQFLSASAEIIVRTQVYKINYV